MTSRGSGPKPTRSLDRVEVTYSKSRWSPLKSMQERAVGILEGLGPLGNPGIVHGSLARGDVDEKSDIDILIPTRTSSQLVEARLEASGFQVYLRELAQATPMHSPKAHVYLDPEQKALVTFPLAPFRRLESEFYRFGGTANLQDLRDKLRRPGCTKKLTLIEPTDEGHVESPVIGHEPEVARKLGVSVDIVRERVRVLTRRDSMGRTGTFLRIALPQGASFEQVLRDEAKANPALRRTLKARKLG